MTYIFSIAFCFCSLFASVSFAESDKIVAVVNDSVITQSDLDNRFKLTLKQMSRTLPREQQELLYQRILGELVDEEIQAQYALSRGVGVTQEELKNAIRFLEQENGLEPGFFAHEINGLEATAEQKIATELAWQKVVERFIQPKVNVSQVEIDRLIKDMLKSQHVIEREVSHIFVSDDNKTPAEAQKILRSIESQHPSAKNFAELAEVYNEDDTAERGGYIGWLTQGELSAELEATLANLAAGEVSGVVRSPAGWHILMVSRTRQTKALDAQNTRQVDIIQYFTPWENEVNNPNQLKQFEQATKSFKSLEDIATADKSIDLGWVDADGLKPALADVIKHMAKGQFSGIISTPEGMHYLYIKDERFTKPDEMANYRERVRKHLTENRTELEARRFMRDLRRNAYVDIRI